MKLIKANQVPRKRIIDFLENNLKIDKEQILQSGYIIEIDDKICGCFVLDHIGEGKYVLKQFFVTRTDALKIPIFVEAVLLLAKQKDAKEIFVHSHKLMIDMILEALQFYPQENNENLNNYGKDEGKWWSYTVSE